MNQFFNLVKFEYIKIFKARVNVIFIGLTLFVSMIIVLLNSFGGNYYSGFGNDMSDMNALKMDREILNEHAGLIDEAILIEMINHVKEGVSNKDNYFMNSYGQEVVKSDFYVKYHQPYYNIFHFIESVFGEDIENLNVEEMTGFYENYKLLLVEDIQANTQLTDGEKQKHIQLIAEIKTPFYNEYMGGWKSMILMLPMLGILCLVLVCVVSSNVFGSEFNCKTDAVILASKHGKTSLIVAKMVTIISFCASTCLAIILVNICSFSFTHGLGGWDNPIQLVSTQSTYSTYPITIGASILICTAVFIVVCVAFGCFGAMLSVLFKNALATISCLFIIIFVPIVIPVTGERWIDQLLNLAPLRIFSYNTIFSDYFYTFGTISVTPAVFYLIASMIGTIIFACIAFHKFKTHQVR